MSLLLLSSFQQYLYGHPKWVYSISINIKFFIIFLYVFSLFYSSINLLLLINFCVSISLLILFFPVLFFYSYLTKAIIYILVFSFIYMITSQIINFKLVNNSLPDYIINCFFEKNKHTKNLLLTRKYLIPFTINILISETVVRFILIIASSILLHKLLLITTYNKNILYSYKIFNLNNNSKVGNSVLFILLLSSECIYFFEIKIKNFCLIFLLRDLKFIDFKIYTNSVKIFIRGFCSLVLIILQDAKHISQSMYSREIIYQKQKIYFIE